MLVLVAIFLVASIFYGLTAHLAARAVVGTVPFTHSLAVGLAPAMGFVSVGAYSPLAAPLVAIPLDFFAIVAVYEVEERVAATVLGVHVVLSILGWLALGGVLWALG